MNLKGRRVLVVGLGASGLAAVEALRELGADVVVTEARAAEEVPEAIARVEDLGASVVAGGHDARVLDGVELAVASPGVPESAEIFTLLDQRGVEVWSELELGARLAACPYVAITGTNGKTTTTELVAAAMRNDGLDAIACGNVGYPLSRAAREDHDALVVEASSFQLRFTGSLHPKVSALLNLAPDHLDWHGSFDEYADAKARIYRGQHDGDVHVGNLDDDTAAAASRDAPCRQAWFTVGESAQADASFEPPGALVVRWDGEPQYFERLPMFGAQRANAAAAALSAIAFGVKPDAVRAALESYEPGLHRGRVVAERNGVRFIDDSKATNPHAALASIEEHAPAVLIAGGLAKGVDLTPLAAAAPHLVGVVAIGEAATEIEGIFASLVVTQRAASIEDAVRDAFALATEGTAVLLAPACASQDMFKDYAERGDRFAAAAERLPHERRNADG